jgi:CSLREA domain-containing protein
MRLLLPAIVLLLIPAGGVAAATITVTSVADVIAEDGVCTLREAIVEANTDGMARPAEGECARGLGADTITFAIPGEGPHRIVLGPQMPDISSPVTIDGYTQAGASPNTVNALSGFDADLRIIIDGGAAVAVLRPALRLAAGSSGSTIRGLEITGFTSTVCCGDVGIVVTGSVSDLVIAGNVIHDNKHSAIFVVSQGNATPITRLRIGGPEAADRNVFYGYPSATIITMQSCLECVVENNWVGIRTDGAPPAIVGNQFGLGMRNVVASAVRDNWLGNSTAGISIDGPNDDVQIANNLIGGSTRNSRAIDIHGNALGATTNLLLERNLITGQSFRGIAISSSVTGNGTRGIRLRGNRLYANGGFNFDLGGDGDGFAGLGSINANDAGDADSGPNGGQNFPLLGTPMQVNNVLQIPYTLDSPAGTYEIEFSFATQCDQNFNALRGSMPRDPLAIETQQLSGTALLQPVGAPIQGFVVATATGSEGSSEFSACVPYVYDVPITVFASGFED